MKVIYVESCKYCPFRSPQGCSNYGRRIYSEDFKYDTEFPYFCNLTEVWPHNPSLKSDANLPCGCDSIPVDTGNGVCCMKCGKEISAA